MKKRILSIILAVVMIAGMIPLGTMTAFAYDAEDLGEITAEYWGREIMFYFSNLEECMAMGGQLYCGEQRMDCMVDGMGDQLMVRPMGQLTTGDYELRIPQMRCYTLSGDNFILNDFVLPFSFDADTETVEIGGGTPEPEFDSYKDGVITFTVPKCKSVAVTGDITVSYAGEKSVKTNITANSSFCTTKDNTLSFRIKNGDGAAITGISDYPGSYTIKIPNVTYVTEKDKTIIAENIELKYYISIDGSFRSDFYFPFDGSYLDWTGKAIEETSYTGNYTILSADKNTWTTGWYVAAGEITLDNAVEVTGDVHLILGDYCNLTVNGSIRGDGHLYVYQQSFDNGTIGKLTCAGTDSDAVSVSLTVNGGIIDITGGQSRAGFSAPDFTVNGGKINIKGGAGSSASYPTPGGAGIIVTASLVVNDGVLTVAGGNPGHCEYSGRTVNGTNGSNGITATSASLTINGGNVTIIGGNGGTGSTCMVINGGDGGCGGIGISSDSGMTVNGGRVRIVGGNGGNGGIVLDKNAVERGVHGGKGGDGAVGISASVLTVISGDVTVIGGHYAYGSNGGENGTDAVCVDLTQGSDLNGIAEVANSESDPLIDLPNGESIGDYRVMHIHIHNFADAEYFWNDDFSKCIAVRSCTVCDYSESETVKTTKTGDTYTAEFTNEAFETQTKTVTDPLFDAKTAMKAEIDNAVDGASDAIVEYAKTAKANIDACENITALVTVYTAELNTINGMKTEEAIAAATKELEELDVISSKAKAIVKSVKPLLAKASSPAEVEEVMKQAKGGINAAEEKVTDTDRHIVNRLPVETDNLMGHQYKIVNGQVINDVGRAIICLTEEQLNKIKSDKVVVVGGDFEKETTFTLDCAYTYFYSDEKQYTAEEIGCAAFLIIDHDAVGGAISGFGYYRVYDGSAASEDNFILDALYVNPNN